MNELSFTATIFNKKKGIHTKITSKRLFIFGILLIFISPQIEGFTGFSTALVAAFSIIVMLAACIWGFYSIEVKNGTLEGRLTISENSINWANKAFRLDSIQELNFTIRTIKNQPIHTDVSFHHRFFGGPSFYLGIDNFVEFKNNKETFKVFFQLKSPDHLIQLKNLIKALYIQNKISKLNTIYCLHSEWEEIQTLKKERILFLNKL